jgi:hypothetical protein
MTRPTQAPTASGVPIGSCTSAEMPAPDDDMSMMKQLWTAPSARINTECAVGGDDAGVLPDVLNARILEFPFEPGQLLRHPGAMRCGHLQVDQEAAAHGLADDAFELAELAEIGGHALADVADHRHLDDHAKGRHTRGAAGKAAQLAVGIVPAPLQRIAAVDGDVHRALLEKGFDGHREPQERMLRPGRLSTESNKGLT